MSAAAVSVVEEYARDKEAYYACCYCGLILWEYWQEVDEEAAEVERSARTAVRKRSSQILRVSRCG